MSNHLVPGTATEGEDYTPASGTVTFPPNVTVTDIHIPLAADAVDEPDESFSVVLSDPVHGFLADGEGTLTILDDDLPPPPNQPPVADAGPDQTLECAGDSTAVTLDGSGSTDPDGEALSYSWTGGPFGTARGVSPTVKLTHGDHTLTLTVTDPHGAVASDQAAIHIVDTPPPVVTVAGDTVTAVTDPSGNAASAARTVRVRTTANNYSSSPPTACACARARRSTRASSAS